MAQKFAIAFYNSKPWRACRKAYIAERIQIDGGLCEHCHEAAGYIVHHKIKLTAANINDPYIALNHKMLEYVCKKCHDIEHSVDIYGYKTAENDCGFDNSGQPIPPIWK